MGIFLGNRSGNSLAAHAWTMVRSSAAAAGLLGLVACSTPGARQAGAPWMPLVVKRGTNTTSGPAGPTLRLDYGRGDSMGNSISEFMYFVPLISPDPVSISESAGNTQRARVVSAQRQFADDRFSVVCEFEITGQGSQTNNFDNSRNIRRNERKLREGGELNRMLAQITIEGPGRGTIEVEGTLTNRVPTVAEVRLRFNDRGKASPVTIGLQDIRYVEGAFCPTNEMVARVNTLTFKRGVVPPRMAVTVASVKRKDAGDGLWQKFVGGVTGVAANLLIKPIRVDATGHEAMLDFGLALAAEEPAFTFPRARHLKTDSASAGAKTVTPPSQPEPEHRADPPPGRKAE